MRRLTWRRVLIFPQRVTWLWRLLSVAVPWGVAVQTLGVGLSMVMHRPDVDVDTSVLVPSFKLWTQKVFYQTPSVKFARFVCISGIVLNATRGWWWGQLFHDIVPEIRFVIFLLMLVIYPVQEDSRAITHCNLQDLNELNTYRYSACSSCERYYLKMVFFIDSVDLFCFVLFFFKSKLFNN